MAAAFNAWTRYDSKRRGMMHAELNRISRVRELSPDVAEIVQSALAMDSPGVAS
jgi:aminopeptidase N